MSSENIFSALAKYNSATDENYLTESFVFVINTLLQRERSVGVEILNQLCVENNEFCFDINEVISVSTQEVTEQGTPDIRIFTPNKLIYIEVKHDSPIDTEQLQQYKKDLESQNATTKRLILLTKFFVDFDEYQGIPDKNVRWSEVYDWLANSKAKDAVNVYLIDSFKSFLEVKSMSIQKVGWEYISGVPALNNLINMVKVAIEGASLTIAQRSGGVEYRGFYIGDNKEFWCGVVYDDHLNVIFEMQDKKFKAKLITKSSYPWRESVAGLIQFYLNLEDKLFFSLDKDKQLEELRNFVKTVSAEAKRIQVKNK